ATPAIPTPSDTRASVSRLECLSSRSLIRDAQSGDAEPPLQPPPGPVKFRASVTALSALELNTSAPTPPATPTTANATVVPMHAPECGQANPPPVPVSDGGGFGG